MDKTQAVSIAVPAIVYVDVGVASGLHASRYQRVGHFPNEFFVHIAAKLIPAIPAHWWRQCEIIELAVVLLVIISLAVRNTDRKQSQEQD